MTVPTRHEDRESHLVELVDEEGHACGQSTVEQAHQLPGQLHRAFSVMVRDDAGRLLLQQRAGAKTRFPLRWANTCCGHPGPGEGLAGAAAKRLAEEVGLSGITLTPVGAFTYRAVDPETGRVEYEYDHVLVGELPAGMVPGPDPNEVETLQWTDLPELTDRLAAEPQAYAPWLNDVLSVIRQADSATGTFDQASNS